VHFVQRLCTWAAGGQAGERFAMHVRYGCAPYTARTIVGRDWNRLDEASEGFCRAYPMPARERKQKDIRPQRCTEPGVVVVSERE
jgi:hypothetical protein